MKNKDLFVIREAIKKAAGLKGAKFAFILSKNGRAINEHIEDIQVSIKPSAEYLEFEEKRLKLCRTLGKIDQTGNGYEIDPENKEKFNLEYDKLDSAYKEAIEEHQKNIDDYRLLLEEKADIDLKPLNFDDIPKDISVEVLDGLYLMVEDND